MHGVRDRRRLGHQRWRTPTSDVVVFVGDGSYLMMNSDIYSTVPDRP